jgi:hypothetical protein
MALAMQEPPKELKEYELKHFGRVILKAQDQSWDLLS